MILYSLKCKVRCEFDCYRNGHQNVKLRFFNFLFLVQMIDLTLRWSTS